MTTKELCDALRHTHPSRTMCKEAADVIERLGALVHDYKLVFGDIHKTELAEMKYRVENTDIQGWTNVGWTDAEQKPS